MRLISLNILKLLNCLILFFCISSCGIVNKSNSFSSCIDEKAVIQKSDFYAQKRLGGKNYSKCKKKVEEKVNYYELSYTDSIKGVLKKGGAGIMFRISKNDCKIFDVIMLQ